MKKHILNMIVGTSFVLSLNGCSGSSDVAASAVDTTTPSTDSGFSADTYLYFTLTSQWEGDAEDAKFKEWGSCSVNSTTAASITCDISVPEGRLFYSKLKFTAGTNLPSTCPIIKFRPYYYKRSSSPTYLPPHADATEVDCSATSPTEKYCYGGAAPTLISTFPTNRGNYFLSVLTPKTSWTLDSGNIVRYYGGNYNYMVTNDLSTLGRTTTGDSLLKTERVANSFVDYTAECVNYWGETLYNITITIKDENMDGSDGSTNDDYPDWQ